MRKYLVLYIPMLICCLDSFAQGIFEATAYKPSSVQLGGYARGSVWGGGSSYHYASAFGELALQSNFAARDVALYADARFRSGYFYREQKTNFELKEAYAVYRPGNFSFSLGQQIVTWGKTDGFNPTNNITPNHYFLLTANPDDQKLPNFFLRTNWQIWQGINWETIAIPVFRPSVYRYELFDLGENVSFTEAEFPLLNYENGSLATRLSFELKGIGFSLSWFNGYDPFYGFEVKSVDWLPTGPVITNVPSFYRKNTAGLDLEIPIKQLIFRAEGAYDFTDNYKTNMHIPNPNAKAVGALEFPRGTFMMLLQYIGQYNFNFKEIGEPKPPTGNLPEELMVYAENLIHFEAELFNRKIFRQHEEWNHALSATLRQSLAYNTLDITLSGYYNLTSEEWMLRPELLWKAAEGLSLSIGGQWMKGREGTVFGHSSKLMNGVFVELKAMF